MEEIDKKSLGQLLHNNRVNKINKAYATYRLDPDENALNDLLQLVIKLSQRKLRPQAAEMGDVGMEDHDDFTQKVAMTVFEKLPEFDREPQAFYPWLMTIIINHRHNLFDHLESASSIKAPIMFQDQDGNEYENPEIYADAKEGFVTYQPPAGLDEEDGLIYDLILEGYTQERIAEAIGIGHATLKRRIRSLKDRFGEVVNA
jgi:RNA polymerase sigma factor (sigma-70 family)